MWLDLLLPLVRSESMENLDRPTWRDRRLVAVVSLQVRGVLDL